MHMRVKIKRVGINQGKCKVTFLKLVPRDWILMKLTTGVNFINMFIYMQLLHSQKRKLSFLHFWDLSMWKLHLKCWWNWHQMTKRKNYGQRQAPRPKQYVNSKQANLATILLWLRDKEHFINWNRKSLFLISIL